MVQLKKKKNKGAEIPTGSMADIAFLLLLFFLVATVIDVDTGIGLSLPEYQDNPDLAPISKDRIAAILVNENGDVLLNKEVIAIPQIKEVLIPRIESKLNLPTNKKLIVSIKTDRKTNYNLYIQTLDQVRLAYGEVKETYSMSTYNKKYSDLNNDERDDVRKKVYEIISIAEPEQIK